VPAILAAIGLTGAERDRLMRMAKGYREQGWWEANKSHLTDQARTYLKFEARAARLVDVEPLLVPGLLQTADYCRALFDAFGVDPCNWRAGWPGASAGRRSSPAPARRSWCFWCPSWHCVSRWAAQP